MPIYEYRCPECGIKFEQIQEYEQRDEVTCPHCKVQVTRLMSTFCYSDTLNHKFFKEGEGFSSVFYDPEEYDYRVTHNAAKYDPI